MSSLQASSLEIVSTIKELLSQHPLYNEHFKFFVQFGAVNLHDPSTLADIGAFLTSADADALQVPLPPRLLLACIFLLQAKFGLTRWFLGGRRRASWSSWTFRSA